MLGIYLKIAFRNLMKYRIFSFLNVVGLSFGMAIVIILSLWIWDELTFDKYHQHYDRIAKVRQNVTVNDRIETLKTVPLPLADELRSHYRSDFRYIVSSSHRLNHVLANEHKLLFRKGVYFSAEAPDMLSLKILKGNRAGLNERNSILLSEQTARMFFGDDDPVDKIMTIDRQQRVKVVGVYEDLPENSTFGDLAFIAPFDLYLAHEDWINRLKNPWKHNPIQLYVQLADNVDHNTVAKRIASIVAEKTKTEEGDKNAQLLLEPMSKWHLYTYNEGSNNTGPVQYIRLFIIVGLIVLLLACINFMNLSTARSEKRAREVGIRKAVGSLRSQLILQFLCESVLTALFSFVISLVFAQLILPYFNETAGKHLSIPWSNGFLWLTGFVFAVVTGLIAGSYPAFYLTSFHPVKVLKGSFRLGHIAALPRKTLVVLQFAVSVTLIICTFVIFRQVEFGKERVAGYDRNNLLLSPIMAGDIPLHFDAVKTELLKAGVITDMARSESTATDIWGTDENLVWEGKDPRLVVEFPNTGVSVDYGKTVRWQFTQGRDFSQQYGTDSSAFILNEAAVKFMGLKDPVGQTILWNGQPFKVIGVIRDMITESPYEPVRPSIYCLARQHDNFAVVRLNPALNTTEAVSEISRVFRKYSPGMPFDYSFVNEQYDRKFQSEERVGGIAAFFSIFAIFISCLGIFGMASFMIEQRKKEIGIRKVFGASVYHVWRLLTNEFVMLVILAITIAIPVSLISMNKWLQDYAYRAELSWWIFALPAVSALLLTLLTVSVQVIKAGFSNPIVSLKEE